MAEVVQLTLAGKKDLEDKLEYLKNVRRAEITEEIAVARSFGDLSENAEYDAAKDAQAHNELEIMELEAMLKNVVIIDETHTDGKTVTMGSIVRIKFVDLGFEDEFKIVALAFTPSRTGVPILTPASSATSRTSNSTSAFTSASSFSTRISSPASTLYCFPPV